MMKTRPGAKGELFHWWPAGVFYPVMSGLIGLEHSRGFRAHQGLVSEEEYLEEMYDRTAEVCSLFDNISEVDKYVTSCVVCASFETCGSHEGEGHSIIDMLKIAYKHDGLKVPW